MEAECPEKHQTCWENTSIPDWVGWATADVVETKPNSAEGAPGVIPWAGGDGHKGRMGSWRSTALPWGVTVLQDHPLPALAAALELMGHRCTGLPIPSLSLSASPLSLSALHMLLLDKSGLIQPRPKAFSFLQTHSFFTHPFLCSLLQLPTLIPPLSCKLILQELTDPFSLLSLHLAKAFSITHTKPSLVLCCCSSRHAQAFAFCARMKSTFIWHLQITTSSSVVVKSGPFFLRTNGIESTVASSMGSSLATTAVIPISGAGALF